MFLRSVDTLLANKYEGNNGSVDSLIENYKSSACLLLY